MNTAFQPGVIPGPQHPPGRTPGSVEITEQQVREYEHNFRPHYDNIVGKPTALAPFSLPNGGRTVPDFTTYLANNAVYNPRDYGAVGYDGVSWLGNPLNDAPAFQACFDAASANGGIVQIPPGHYRLASTLTVPANLTILGSGGASRLDFIGCDAFVFALGDTIGPARISNFWINGFGVEAKTAIQTAGTTDVGARITGLTFDNLYVSFFGTGMALRNLWHSRVWGCTMQSVHRGIALRGRSVKVSVSECSILRGNLAVTGIGGQSIGISADSDSAYTPVTEARPEDVQVYGNIVFGFDVAVDWQRVLFGGVWHNDLDYCTHTGIRVQQFDGGVTIASNWISLDTDAARYGIDCIALGFVPTLAHGTIRNNTLRHNAVTPNPACVGIRVGSNQSDLLLDGNECSGFPTADIQLNQSRRVQVLRNRCRTTTSGAFSISITATQDHTVCDGNTVAAPLFQHPTTCGPVTWGETFGHQSTRVRGVATIPEGATTVTVALSALNGAPPNFIEGSPSFLSGAVRLESPEVNLGSLWATFNGSSVTISCSTPAPAGGATIRFTVQAQGALD